MKALMWNKERTIAMGVLFGIAAVVGAWWYFDSRSLTYDGSTTLLPLAERTVSEGVAGEATREYKNERFGFSLQYPQSLGVKEYDEAGGALSVTFQSVVDKKEFQIYVTPYAEMQITDVRFMLDVPSGVIKEPVDVVVDGLRGTIFFSQNSVMGETREVWFIHGGFLYEVVTYKELDEWLANIMTKWQFLEES